MSDNLDMILKSFASGDKKKNEELIRRFLATSEGRDILTALTNSSQEDIARLINSVPKSRLDKILANPENLQSILNDPAAMKKMKEKLG